MIYEYSGIYWLPGDADEQKNLNNSERRKPIFHYVAQLILTG